MTPAGRAGTRRDVGERHVRRDPGTSRRAGARRSSRATSGRSRADDLRREGKLRKQRVFREAVAREDAERYAERYRSLGRSRAEVRYEGVALRPRDGTGDGAVRGLRGPRRRPRRLGDEGGGRPPQPGVAVGEGRPARRRGAGPSPLRAPRRAPAEGIRARRTSTWRWRPPRIARRSGSTRSRATAGSWGASPWRGPAPCREKTLLSAISDAAARPLREGTARRGGPRGRPGGDRLDLSRPRLSRRRG